MVNDTLSMPQCAISLEKYGQAMDATVQLLSSQGYETMHSDTLAARLSVTVDEVERCFPTKASLFQGLMEYYCDAVWQPLLEQDYASLAPTELLRQLGVNYLRFLVSDPLVIMYRVVLAEAKSHPELAEIFFERGPARGITRLEAYLEQQHQQGKLQCTDVKKMVKQYMHLVRGVFMRLHTMGLATRLIEEEIAAHIDEVVYMMVSAYDIH